MTPTIAVVGAHGHGRSHLSSVLERHRSGELDLIGIADPRPLDRSALADAPRAAQFETLADLLDARTPDTVVICTPIHTHAELSLLAVRAGADVLLEKPPTATSAEFETLRAAAEAGGRLVQVGFQSLGSAAIAYVRARVTQGKIGDVVRYSATAGWTRPESYWTRAAWAGRRRIDDRIVADGVLTNPLAHATATALALADRQHARDVTGLVLDLHRANDIEADDTSVARFALREAATLTTAVTLCAAEREEPFVEVTGTRGGIRLYYALDVVQEWDARGHLRTTKHGRTALLDDLLDARRHRHRLIAPLEACGGFMRLMDAVVDGPAAAPVPADAVSRVDGADGVHRVIRGVEDALRRATATERTFRELGIGWAA